MYDSELLFDKYISDMQDELLALKTFHPRPLGAFDFYTDTLDFEANFDEFDFVDINITVTVEADGKMPVVQIGIDTPAKCWRPEIDGITISDDFTTWTYHIIWNLIYGYSAQKTDVNFGVISSVPIDSITWEYA